MSERAAPQARNAPPAASGQEAAPRRKTAAQPGPATVQEALHSPGQSLEAGIRAFMEPRFGYDFSGVRVHTDSQANAASRNLNAAAYTLGQDIAFSTGQYAPHTLEGRHLLAHELTHVVQQRSPGLSLLPNTRVATHSPAEREAEGMATAILYAPWRQRTIQHSVAGQIQPSGTPLYSPEQRSAMHEGRITASQDDLTLAARFSFQPGDIVFRLGSSALAALINEPVTHGGVYLGGGLIHDMVGFGNRNVGVAAFYREAADPSVVKVIRFTGPFNNLIVARLVSNIQRRDFRLPTDPQPWNLFSSADDYRTATCLEYAHAQFLYSIQQLSTDPSVPESDRQTLRTTYFAAGASTPRDLIRPSTLSLTGSPPRMPTMGSSDPYSSSSMSSGPSAMTQIMLLQLGADMMADDVDPTVFRNRFEGQYQVHYPEGLLGWLLGPTHDSVTLRTFTYRSFVDSRQFFTVIR